MEIGDVVYLKSGSLKMTIVGMHSKDGASQVTVRWVQKDEMVEATFPEDCVSEDSELEMIAKL
jgi:uncharacterized protein YodC (DUF2158 family)